MTGSGILTMLMFLSLALFAYMQAAPRARAAHGETISVFKHTPPKGCALGMHYSSFYHGCAAWAHAKY